MARVPARSGVIVDGKRVKKCTTKGCRREYGDERENLVRCAKEGLQEEGGVEGKKFVVGERERESERKRREEERFDDEEPKEEWPRGGWNYGPAKLSGK